MPVTRPRRQGDRPVGKTVTLPAGTRLRRAGGTRGQSDQGRPAGEQVLAHDMAISVDNIDGDFVTICGWDYEVWGWAEADY